MRSISRHLTVRLCALAAVLLPCGLLAVYLLARQLLLAQFDETIAAKAEALIAAAEVDGDEIEIDLDVQHFAGFGSSFTGDFFEVRRANGEILLRSPSLENHLFTFSNIPPRGLWLGEVNLPEGNSGRASAFPFVPDRDRANQFTDLQLIVASDSSALRKTLRALFSVLLITGAVGLLAALILIRLGLNRGLRPLNSLATEVEDLKIDDSGLRLETKFLPDELRGVGEKLNHLLERVEQSIARERRFSSHAAHELRTPLAELKLMAESFAKWPDEATPEGSAEMLAVISEVEDLLNKLSLLARADAGAYAVQLEPVVLARTIDRALERESATINSRHLKLSTEIQSAPFRTDPVLWQTILTNLIGNAAHHAPASSTIHLTVTAQSLTITNPAPNLTPADLPLLFERFWRKDTSRDTQNHSGLGLAIVQSAVTLLHGTCEATLDSGNLRISIQWK